MEAKVVDQVKLLINKPKKPSGFQWVPVGANGCEWNPKNLDNDSDYDSDNELLNSIILLNSIKPLK